MNVVLLTDCWRPVRNGVVHHVELLARGLTAAGYKVTVLAPGPTGDDEPGVVRYGGLPLGSTGYYVGWPADPRVWRLLHDADLLHTHHPFLSGNIAAHAAQRSGAPLVFTSHTRYDAYVEAYAPWLPQRPAQALVQNTVRDFSLRCAAVIAPSASAAAVIKSWGVQTPLTVIPNGIEVERFAAARADDSHRQRTRATLGLGPDDVVSLYVGRLSAEKRVLALLESFAAARSAGLTSSLLLVGSGGQEPEARAQAEGLGIGSAVHFAGSRSYTEMPAIMAASDIFVSASLSEGHPLTFLEAAATGLPALAHHSPGIADIVVDTVTGLLAPPPGASGPDSPFVDRWLALAGNHALRRQLGEAAALRAQEYSAQATTARVVALYQSLPGNISQ